MQRIWLGLIIASLFVSGCQKEPLRVGGVPREKVYKTAVSLSPSTTEIMVGLINTVQLVGRTQSCNFPPGLKMPVVADLKPDYEKIAKIKPDIIVFDGTLYNDTDKQKFKQLGIETLDFSPKTIDDYVLNMQELGNKLGNETNLDEFVIKINNLVSMNATNKPEVPVKVAALMTGSNKDYMIAGDKSFLGDIIKKSGGEVIGQPSEVFVALSPEFLINGNPDIIITSGDPKMILQDPRFSTVNAVKNNLVAKIDPDVMLRAGLRVESLLRDLGVLIRKTALKKQTP